MNDFTTCGILLNEDRAKALIADLFKKSAWFEFTPYPDGEYEIRYKTENEKWVRKIYTDLD